MTEAEARRLRPGDRISRIDGAPFSFGEIVATVSRVESIPWEHTHIWIRETDRFLLPGQCSREA